MTNSITTKKNNQQQPEMAEGMSQIHIQARTKKKKKKKENNPR